MFVKNLVRSSPGSVFQMDNFEALARASEKAPEAPAQAEPTATVMQIQPPDPSIVQYLKEWGLSIYIDKFKEHSIDLDTLQILTAEDIKELVPVIGHRAKLMMQIAMLKDIVTDAFALENATIEELDLADVEHTDQASTQASSVAEPESEPRKDCKLYDTLIKYNEGKGLLLRYQEKGLLDNAARRRLCNIIITEELKDDPKKTLTSSRLYQLAFEITEIFKKESSSVYFIPFASFSPKQKISAKGKLLDCYRQRRRDYIKSGIIKARERRSSASSSCSEMESPGPSTRTQAAVMQLEDHLESDTKEEMLWLRNCCDPWETVEQYWNITTKTRLNMLQNNECTIQEYYSEFKALNQPGGIFLLLKDYTSLYNNKMMTNKWLLMRPKLIELAKKRTDAFLKSIIADADNEHCEEVMDIIALMAIPFLMTTSNVTKTKSKSKRLWRPSKQEALEGFITHVKSAAQVEETIARRVEKLREFEVTLQPFIIIVGPNVKQISARYIVVNNVRYEATTIMNSVDACFKIIFVLNAQYPAESTNVWQLIQIALFGLKTKYDKIYTTVNTLLTDLNLEEE